MRRSLRRRASQSTGFSQKSAFIESMEQRILLSVFTVNNTDDAGTGSLRQAIINSNTTPALTNTIDFSINSGVQTIEPLSPLPTITQAVIIDGSSQPGYGGTPLIVLDGQNTNPGNGLEFAASASGSTVKDMDINEYFGYAAVYLNGASDDSITGNYLGLDVTGEIVPGLTISAEQTGVLIDSGATGNIIGGTTAASRNVISGNSSGVRIVGTTSGPQTADNIIEGNYIGTDYTGNALPNVSVSPVFAENYVDLDGVNIGLGASQNTVGGTTTASRNVISGNSLVGVVIAGNPSDLPSSQNVVEGNYIGSDSTAANPLPNGVGIYVFALSIDNSIGGSSLADGNLIAFNTGAGVVIGDATADNLPVGNDIRLNTIYGNGGLGIDLGNDGITANSPGGPHSGPNDFQNAPVLSSAVSNGTALTIVGTLNSTASSIFLIDFYSNPTLDANGTLQGRTYLGSEDVTTDATGNAPINLTLPAAMLSAGDYVTATATTTAASPYGDTSEFAAPVQDTAVPTVVITAPNVVYNGKAQGATASVLGAGNTVVGTATLTYYKGPSTSGTPLVGTPMNAGTYTVVAKFAGGDGYTISSATATYTIGQAALTITANNQSRTYGAANPALTVSYIGFVNSQTATALTTQPSVTTLATQSSDVGNYAINVSGAVDANYSITYVGAELTITQAVLTVTVNNASKKQGKVNPAFALSYSGFVLGQGPTALGGSPIFTTAAKKKSAKRTYLVYASGLSSADYSFNYVPGTLTIK